MASRIRIFNHFCKFVAELDNIPTTPRSWILNGYGRLEMSLGYDKEASEEAGVVFVPDKVRENILQFGNLVYVEHIPSRDENDAYNGILPDWVGIILPPRTWDYGVVHINAFSAEAILQFRAMPFINIVQKTPKQIFKKIIDESVISARNIPIQYGQMDDIGISFSDTLRTNAYDHILKLVKDSRMDWSITGDINNKGNLDLYANLYYRKGIDTSLSLTNSNTELQSPLLTEQGTISNQVFGHSQAQTDKDRFSNVKQDQFSIDDYGVFQINQVYMGRRDPASVEYASQSRIDRRGRPIKLISRVALDKKNTFDYLNIGNTVIVKDTSVGFHKDGGFGFESICKIIAMNYNDLSNKCSLTVEVIKDVEVRTQSSQIVEVGNPIEWDNNEVIQWDNDVTIDWDA